MIHVAPKASRGRSGEYFAINEPGREPFYVHAYHAGSSQQAMDLQVRCFGGGKKHLIVRVM